MSSAADRLPEPLATYWNEAVGVFARQHDVVKIVALLLSVYFVYVLAGIGLLGATASLVLGRR